MTYHKTNLPVYPIVDGQVNLQLNHQLIKKRPKVNPCLEPWLSRCNVYISYFPFRSIFLRVGDQAVQSAEVRPGLHCQAPIQTHACNIVLMLCHGGTCI